ncbi:MAG: NAD(P)/FAD-dependent oxidoreductase [Candidatus Bathyarchaeia archaeon]
MPVYDLLVVGAGTTGCLAAKTAAKKGLSVLLIDRKSKSKVGKKVCGDAVGEHYFDKLNLRPPSGKEFKGRIEGFRIISPDRKTTLTFKAEDMEGFMIDRYEFGQRLLREALDAGVIFRGRTTALDPIIEAGFVKGVVARDVDAKKKSEIRGKVTLDASGYDGVIREKMPPELLPERTIANGDIQICFREIRRISAEMEPWCLFLFSRKISPGGYSWIFPRNDGFVNVGIGIQMVRGFPNPRRKLYEHILTLPLFENSGPVIDGGGWFEPTRRPIDCLVANGFMVGGDAAFLTNPITGGGIGPSMISGKLAGEMVAEAIEKDDLSAKGLWRYNSDFMAAYGAKQAALDVFRMLLQRLSDEDLSFGMSHKLIKEEDILKTSSDGRLRLTISDRFLRALRGLSRHSLLRQLSKVGSLMSRMKELYLNYPQPAEFPMWRSGVARVMRDLDQTLR